MTFRGLFKKDPKDSVNKKTTEPVLCQLMGQPDKIFLLIRRINGSATIREKGTHDYQTVASSKIEILK